ncbi:MAG: hypothetical protein AVDCRST_MAG49-1236, partial [uncultured Thermomicrobiales bacterium]
WRAPAWRRSRPAIEPGGPRRRSPGVWGRRAGRPATSARGHGPTLDRPTGGCAVHGGRSSSRWATGAPNEVGH